MNFGFTGSHLLTSPEEAGGPLFAAASAEKMLDFSARKIGLGQT
jgi:hypothetical protein